MAGLCKIYTVDFKTRKKLDDLLKLLDSVDNNFTWGIRDSEYDGRYISGKFGYGGKIRIVDYESYMSREIYFTDEHKEEIREEVLNSINNMFNLSDEFETIKEY